MPTPLWKRGESGNPTGRSVRNRVAARSLAFTLREAMSDDEVARILMCLIKGEEPFPKVDAEGKPIAGMGGPPIDIDTRMTALKMYLDRRNGSPMQEVHIKAELEAMVAHVHTPLAELVDLERLAPAALDVLEAGLAGALEAGAIDVESTEVE
jgi:hypothetical protein